MRDSTKRFAEQYRNDSDKDVSLSEEIINKRLDLNVLLKRVKDQKNKDKKFNILIICAISIIITTVLLIFGL